MVRIKLVGCNYHKTTIETKENDIVKIKKEFDNEFDKYAIAVFNSLNEKIGYVASKKTVSPGNRKNGCIDNIELSNIIDNETSGVITKFKGYFGFVEVST